MKKISVILFAVMLTALLLCGCNEKKAEAAGDELATIASEVKDDLDGMVGDGTVKDGDGYIGDGDPASEAYTESATDPTDPTGATDGADGLTDSDEPTDESEFI